jgi:hypothetical protein
MSKINYKILRNYFEKIDKQIYITIEQLSIHNLTYIEQNYVIYNINFNNDYINVEKYEKQVCKDTYSIPISLNEFVRLIYDKLNEILFIIIIDNNTLEEIERVLPIDLTKCNFIAKFTINEKNYKEHVELEML